MPLFRFLLALLALPVQTLFLLTSPSPRSQHAAPITHEAAVSLDDRYKVIESSVEKYRIVIELLAFASSPDG